MDSSIFDKAQSILTNRRMKAVSENEQRISEVNKKYNDQNKNNYWVLSKTVCRGQRKELVNLKIGLKKLCKRKLKREKQCKNVE